MLSNPSMYIRADSGKIRPFTKKAFHPEKYAKSFPGLFNNFDAE